jgi:hypothetical protein
MVSVVVKKNMRSDSPLSISVQNRWQKGHQTADSVFGAIGISPYIDKM